MSSSAPASAPKATVPAPAPSAAATTKTTKKKTVKKATGAGTTAKPKKKPRRKRPPSSSRNTPQNAQTIWNNAGIAQKELDQHAALQAALRSDPLWYRTDDPLKSIDQDSFMVAGGGSGVLADQVEIVEAALAANHLTRAEVTPQAYACLLEQARRYALELLADAQDYAYSANRYDVTRADLVLAQELRADQPLADFTQQPKLLHLAHQVNQKPLPPIPTTNYTGVVLPPKEHQLTARTFDVVSGARVAQRMVAPVPAPAASKTATTTPMQPSYGASRGRQIPIHISQQTKEASILLLLQVVCRHHTAKHNASYNDSFNDWSAETSHAVSGGINGSTKDSSTSTCGYIRTAGTIWRSSEAKGRSIVTDDDWWRVEIDSVITG